MVKNERSCGRPVAANCDDGGHDNNTTTQGGLFYRMYRKEGYY